VKVKDLESLNPGISGIEIEGDVIYTLEPKHWKGTTKKGRKYDFWNQFVVVEDDSGTVGCAVSIREEDVINENDRVRVKGKLSEYKDKNGEIQRRLDGRIIKDKKEKTGEDNGKDSEDKNKMIAREVAVKAAVELIKAKEIKLDEEFTHSEKIVDYIYGGCKKEVAVETKTEEPPDQEEKPSLAKHIVKEEKLEIREGHENDKIIDDEDIPGSSFDNPIPRKKKISKAEDFVQEGISE